MVYGSALFEQPCAGDGLPVLIGAGLRRRCGRCSVVQRGRGHHPPAISSVRRWRLGPAGCGSNSTQSSLVTALSIICTFASSVDGSAVTETPTVRVAPWPEVLLWSLPKQSALRVPARQAILPEVSAPVVRLIECSPSCGNEVRSLRCPLAFGALLTLKVHECAPSSSTTGIAGVTDGAGPAFTCGTAAAAGSGSPHRGAPANNAANDAVSLLVQPAPAAEQVRWGSFMQLGFVGTSFVPCVSRICCPGRHAAVQCYDTGDSTHNIGTRSCPYLA